MKSNGTKFSIQNITRELNTIFGKNISTSMLRHIYLSNLYKDIPKLNLMIKTAADMGHSVGEAMKYIKHWLGILRLWLIIIFRSIILCFRCRPVLNVNAREEDVRQVVTEFPEPDVSFQFVYPEPEDEIVFEDVERMTL